MNLAQVVTFRVKKGKWDDLVALARNWHRSYAHTDGHIDTLLWRKVSSPEECVAVVLFEDAPSLVAFSEKKETLRFFDEAKKYFDGNLDYYHVEAITADLF